MSETCSVLLLCHKPTKLPNRGCRCSGWCWCRLGPWRQRRRPWSWRNCHSWEEQRDEERFQKAERIMDFQSHAPHPLQHLERCTDFDASSKTSPSNAPFFQTLTYYYDYIHQAKANRTNSRCSLISVRRSAPISPDMKVRQNLTSHRVYTSFQSVRLGTAAC